jgi:membrane protein insertase Oxa1/YidC/SpoIIIJ
MNSKHTIILALLANIIATISMFIFSAVMAYRDQSGLGLYWFIALAT